MLVKLCFVGNCHLGIAGLLNFLSVLMVKVLILRRDIFFCNKRNVFDAIFHEKKREFKE